MDIELYLQACLFCFVSSFKSPFGCLILVQIYSGARFVFPHSSKVSRRLQLLPLPVSSFFLISSKATGRTRSKTEKWAKTNKKNNNKEEYKEDEVGTGERIRRRGRIWFWGRFFHIIPPGPGCPMLVMLAMGPPIIWPAFIAIGPTTGPYPTAMGLCIGMLTAPVGVVTCMATPMGPGCICIRPGVPGPMATWCKTSNITHPIQQLCSRLSRKWAYAMIYLLLWLRSAAGHTHGHVDGLLGIHQRRLIG